MRNISIALIISLMAAGAAYAEEQSGSPPPAQPETQPASAAAAVPATSEKAQAAAPRQLKKRAKPTATGSPSATGPSRADPAYAQKLASAVRAHVPSTTNVGPGSASCNFQVTANGAMSGISCKGSSPAHSRVLQKAIASTKAPPPPGGSFSANQSIVFH